jgi:hypothetical protein
MQLTFNEVKGSEKFFLRCATKASKLERRVLSPLRFESVATRRAECLELRDLSFLWEKWGIIGNNGNNEKR